MQLIWLSLAIASTVDLPRHPQDDAGRRQPGVALMATCRSVALLFAAVLVQVPRYFAWREEARQLNWTAIALALAIIGL